jgi:hypothetical protein
MGFLIQAAVLVKAQRREGREGDIPAMALHRNQPSLPAVFAIAASRRQTL